MEEKQEEEKQQINKVKRLRVSTQIIANMIDLSVEQCDLENPEVIRVGYSPTTNCWDVFIRSDSFDPVPEGSPIPEMDDPLVSKDVIRSPEEIKEIRKKEKDV